MKVYFDRNIFGDITESVKNFGTNDDIAVLQSAVDKGKLTILLSTTVLQETFPLLSHSTNTFRDELKEIFRLVKKRRMIKPADNILREAVESYAYNRKLPDMQTKTPRFLEDFLNNGKNSPSLSELMDVALSERENFINDFNQRFAEARKSIEERNVGSPANFKDYWQSIANYPATELAKRYDLVGKCEERGIEGLLNVKPIRLYSIYYAYWTFSKLFGEQKVAGKVKSGERGDFFHSVQAAAADIFVTNDERLKRWLNEIPVDNFRIIDFKQLIENIL